MSSFRYGDLVLVSIYGAGPSTGRRLGAIRGTIFNADFEYDVQLLVDDEDILAEDIEWLNDIEPGLGDSIAEDHHLLRNCQSEHMELLEEGDPAELALEAFGEALDLLRSAGENPALAHLERIYEDLSGRIVG